MAEKAVWLLLAVVLLKTWYVEGLFTPLVVPGGSMATTLLGTHRKVVCQDCGFRFDCGIEPHAPPERAVCPNCGHVDNDIADAADVSGDRVLMHKSAFLFRGPRVWEVVAFRDPAQANRIMVKRVVGLPGESISIKHGDVYANGKIRRKPLWLQRAMAVLVHDAGYSTEHFDAENKHWVTDRWATDGPDSQWGFADGKFAHPQSVANGKTQWLTYCHGRPAFGKTPRQIPSPVTDLCGYNQTRSRRVEDVHTVGDLMLSLRVRKFFGRGSLSIRASDTRSEFLIRLTVEPPLKNGNEKTSAANLPTGIRQASVEMWRDGRPLEDLGRRWIALRDGSNSGGSNSGGSNSNGAKASGFALEVSLFDRRLLVAVDGRIIVDCPYEHAPTPADPASNSQGDVLAACRPLAVGRDGLGLIMEDVRVYRDVYYAAPPVVAGKAKNFISTRLADDEYYVLGDNSSISSDSRNWAGGPSVSAKLLVGKPLAVHIPSRRVVVAGREFQVPDIARIRYIR